MPRGTAPRPGLTSPTPRLRAAEAHGLSYFTTNFCNATGMFAYVSAASGCYYQRGGSAISTGGGTQRPDLPWVGARQYVRAARPRHRPGRGASAGSERRGGLIARQHGVRAPGHDTAQLQHEQRRLRRHRSSDIDSDKVRAFVAERIAVERLACSPF